MGHCTISKTHDKGIYYGVWMIMLVRTNLLRGLPLVYILSWILCENFQWITWLRKQCIIYPGWCTRCCNQCMLTIKSIVTYKTDKFKCKGSLWFIHRPTAVKLKTQRIAIPGYIGAESFSLGDLVCRCASLVVLGRRWGGGGGRWRERRIPTFSQIFHVDYFYMFTVTSAAVSRHTFH